MKKFLVQAILVDNKMETVIDSVQTDNFEPTLERFMKRHKHNVHYIYIVMALDTHEIIVKTTKNKFTI